MALLTKYDNLISTVYTETKATVDGVNIDLSTANYFTKTITEPTTLTVSGIPPSGYTLSFILELTDAGTHIVTWWSGLTWKNGTPPTLTATGVDILGFYTYDGGTTWRGLVLAKDVS
jgi:hypothetical protein